MGYFFPTISTYGIGVLVAVSSLLPATNFAVAQATNPSEPLQVAATPQMSEKSSTTDKTLVGLAASSENFTTLAAAIEAADLVDILNGSDVFTVFAPTDEAFAALPEGTLDTLLQPENKEQLVQILTYHVVSGSVMSGDLEEGTVTSVEGSELAVEIDGSDVAIGEAKVIQADIEASNGVIHAIDQVLLPPAQ
ncbi:MAG: fasciclin domain-containing protein [Synechococcus sp.]